MNIIRNIVLFLLANGLGFMAAPIAYNVALLSGALSLETLESNAATLQINFFTTTAITWIFCALFSLGFFLVKSKLRLIFLLFPALLPLLYGLSILAGLS